MSIAGIHTLWLSAAERIMTHAIVMQGGTAEPAEAADAGIKIQSLWDLVTKGGPMMIPIGICSFVALTVIIERLVSLRRSRIIPSGFLSGLPQDLTASADRKLALEYCRRDGSPISHIFATGISRLHHPLEVLERHIGQAGEREVFKLRRYLRALAVVSSVAPLLGLLGTIIGLIDAFQTVALSAEALGKAESLAKGIYEAMITTAAGLPVAIPALIGYHFIAARIDRLLAEMDDMTISFLETHVAGLSNPSILTRREAEQKNLTPSTPASRDGQPTEEEVVASA